MTTPPAWAGCPARPRTNCQWGAVLLRANSGKRKYAVAVILGEPVDFCSARKPSAMRAGSSARSPASCGCGGSARTDPCGFDDTTRLSPVFSPLCLIGYQSRSAVGGSGAGSPMMSARSLSSAWGRLLTPPMLSAPRGSWNQASLTVSVPPAASSRLTSTPASRRRGSSESELKAIAMRLPASSSC